MIGTSLSAPTDHRRLGAGGWARCTARRDTKLNRDVAIKVLPAALSRRTPSAWPASSARLSSSPRSTIRTSPHVYGFESATLADGRPRTSWRWSSSRRGSRRAAEARRDPRRRSDRHREADRRSPRGGTRARHRPPRPQAREHQGDAGRQGQGARLRPRQGLGGPAAAGFAPTCRTRPRSPHTGPPPA